MAEQNKLKLLYILDIMKKTDGSFSAICNENGEKTVIILVNNEENDRDIKLWGDYNTMEIHRTDKDTNCEKVYDGEFNKTVTLPARSITTIVLNK